jgi:hypothetical protein
VNKRLVWYAKDIQVQFGFWSMVWFNPSSLTAASTEITAE